MSRLLRMHLIRSSRQLVSLTLKKLSRPSSRPRSRTIVYSTTLTCSIPNLISLRRATRRSRSRSRRLMKEDNWTNRKRLILRFHLLMKCKCLIKTFKTLKTRPTTPRTCSKRSKHMWALWLKCSNRVNSSFALLRNRITMMELSLQRTILSLTWLS